MQRCGARWSCGGAGVGRAVSTLRCLPHACRQSSETCYARLCHGLRHIRVNCWRMFCACARTLAPACMCAPVCVSARLHAFARARARKNMVLCDSPGCSAHMAREHDAVCAQHMGTSDSPGRGVHVALRALGHRDHRRGDAAASPP